jgi:hypothetical protein
MTKRSTLIFFYLFIGLVVNAQQEPLYEPIDLLQEKDVFFNQKLINPTFLTDSNKVYVDYVAHEKILENTLRDAGFSIFGETCLSSNSFGLNIDFRTLGAYKNRSLTASFKHKFIFKHKSIFEIGLNLGVSQLENLGYSQYELKFLNSFSEINIGSKPNWIEIPLINLGLAYKYRNHSFGLSYDMLSTTVSSGFSERDLKKTGLIASYWGHFNVSNRFILIPELYGCFHSDEMYGIMAVKFNYFNKLTGGITYNTKESITCQLSVLILKRIKLGYSIGSYKSNTINLYTLNLGLKI